MSCLCRLYSIHSLGSRPLNWTCIPREKYNVITRARTTGRERYQSSKDDGNEGNGLNPLWDSNVESVRRRNRNRKSDAREEKSSAGSTPDWLTPKKAWTFNPLENGQEEKGTKTKTKTKTKPEPEEEPPWWNFSKANYDYEDEEAEDVDDEDEDEDDEEYDMKSEVFSSLRWGIPLSFVVLPWLLGNPVIILLGLAAVPAVQKAVGPAVNEVWRAFLDVAGSSPAPKRRRKEAETDDDSGSYEVREDAYSSWGGKSYRYKKSASYDNSPAEPFPYSDGQGSQQSSKVVSMGGWEDLEGEADRRGRMPVRRTRRSSKLGWRSRKKKEKPLFVRLLVALFPFLRNWGGWLSVFLFFPFLESSHFR